MFDMQRSMEGTWFDQEEDVTEPEQTKTEERSAGKDKPAQAK